MVETRSTYRKRNLNYHCLDRPKKRKRCWEDAKSVLIEMLRKRQRFASRRERLTHEELRRLFDTGQNEKYGVGVRYVERKNRKGIIVCLPGIGGGYSGPTNLFEKIARQRSFSTLILNTGYDPNVAKQIAMYAMIWLRKNKNAERVVLIGYSMGVATAAHVVQRNADIIVGVCGVSSQSAHTHGLTKIHQDARVLLLHHAHDCILPRKESAEMIYKMLKSENVNTNLQIFGEKKRHGASNKKSSSSGLECLREHTLFDEIDVVFETVRMFIRNVL